LWKSLLENKYREFTYSVSTSQETHLCSTQKVANAFGDAISVTQIKLPLNILYSPWAKCSAVVWREITQGRQRMYKVILGAFA